LDFGSIIKRVGFSFDMSKERGKEIKLKRELGLLEATFAGVGIIVGAGIYALLGIAAGTVGNAVWMSFGVGSIVALFTGLSYAELSSMYPDDSGEYLYVKKGLSERLGFLTAWMIAVTMIFGASGVAVAFAGYFLELLPFFAVPALVIASAMVIIFGLINYWGIEQSAKLNIIFTSLEVLGLVAIVGMGIGYLGSVDIFEMTSGWGGVLAGAALTFWAFIGFESVVKLTEECREPEKTIPKALMLSIVITTILYIFVAVSAVSIVGWEVLGASDAPMAAVAGAVLGSSGFWILGIIALFSTANTVLVIEVTTSRQVYGVAEMYKKLRWFAKVNRRHLPGRAIWLTMFWVFGFLFLGELEFLIQSANFAVFFSFAIVNAALIAIRYKEPQAKRPFRVPLNIGKVPILPVLGIFVSLFMLVNLEMNVILSGLLILVVGLVIFELVKSEKTV